MAVTEKWGKGVLQVVFDTEGGNWVISQACKIRAIRLTGNLEEDDYLIVYEADGDNPVIARLNAEARATAIWSNHLRRIGIDWDNSNISHPSEIILSMDIETNKILYR